MLSREAGSLLADMYARVGVSIIQHGWVHSKLIYTESFVSGTILSALDPAEWSTHRPARVLPY